MPRQFLPRARLTPFSTHNKTSFVRWEAFQLALSSFKSVFQLNCWRFCKICARQRKTHWVCALTNHDTCATYHHTARFTGRVWRVYVFCVNVLYGYRWPILVLERWPTMAEFAVLYSILSLLCYGSGATITKWLLGGQRETTLNGAPFLIRKMWLKPVVFTASSCISLPLILLTNLETCTHPAAPSSEIEQRPDLHSDQGVETPSKMCKIVAMFLFLDKCGKLADTVPIESILL